MHGERTDDRNVGGKLDALDCLQPNDPDRLDDRRDFRDQPVAPEAAVGIEFAALDDGVIDAFLSDRVAAGQIGGKPKGVEIDLVTRERKD